MKNSKVQQCGSEPINKQMSTCNLLNRYQKAYVDFNVTVEGYHFIKDPFEFKIQPGHVIGWTGTGNISITNNTQDFGGDLGPASSYKYSFHIKQYVSEVTETSYSTNFSLGQNYIIRATVIGEQGIRNQWVNVVPFLETVKITTLSCDFEKSCQINAVSTPECIFNFFF